MSVSKQLTLIAIVILLILSAAVFVGFLLDYYSNSKFIVPSPLVRLTVNGSNTKKVDIKAGERFYIDWQVAESLAAADAKCSLTGYDGSNLFREVGYKGRLVIDRLPGGDMYFYTIGCSSGGKEYIDYAEINTK